MMGSITSGRATQSLLAELAAPYLLTARLAIRHLPQLLLAATLGLLAHDVLLYAAVETGLVNALAGMVVLSLVVLAKLVVTVTMLMLLRPDLPAIRLLKVAQKTAGNGRSVDGRQELLPMVSVAILPFFAYYAAWGFLGDTVREYSRVGLTKTPFGESANFLDVLQSSWLVASIALCWAIRWAVKRARKSSASPVWPMLIIACDATWIFIGLYGLSIWQDELMRWIGSGDFLRGLPNLEQVDAMLSITAWAAGDFVPVELQRPGVLEEARRLFFYALLPLVWLVMTAIVYGYDLAPGKPRRPVIPGSGALKWLADFAGHFIADYRDRYMPVLRSVMIALRAGLPTLVALVVGYRLLSYAGAWAWMGAIWLAGERSLGDIQLIGEGVGFLFGSLSDQNGGILLDPLRICLLAASFELAVAHTTVRRSGTQAGQAAG